MKYYRGISDDSNIHYCPIRDRNLIWADANLIGYNLYRIKLENNPKNDLWLGKRSKIIGDL